VADIVTILSQFFFFSLRAANFAVRDFFSFPLGFLRVLYRELFRRLQSPCFFFRSPLFNLKGILIPFEKVF